MENTSPFGDVCGLTLVGTCSKIEKKILMIVSLTTDMGLNVVHMKQKGIGLEWNGAGNVEWEVRSDGKLVNVSTAYSHTVEENTLHLSCIIEFHPHGYIRLKDVDLILDAEPLKVEIPDDIVEEHLSPVNDTPFTAARRLRNIDRVHSKAVGTSPSKKLGRISKESSDGFNDRPKLQFFHGKPHTFKEQMKIDSEKKLTASKQTVSKAEDFMGVEITYFVKSLMATHSARTLLVSHWNHRKPCRGEHLADTFNQFMEILLYARMGIVVTHDSLSFFEDGSLPITVAWMSTSQQTVVTKMYLNKIRLFNSVKGGISNQYCLSECYLDTMIKKLVCRQSLVQAFALLCYDYGVRWKMPVIFLSFISALGKLYIEHRCDAFVMRLRIAIDCSDAKSAIEQIGMFVSLNGGNPEYAVQVIKKIYPWQPSTPHLLL